MTRRATSAACAVALLAVVGATCGGARTGDSLLAQEVFGGGALALLAGAVIAGLAITAAALPRPHRRRRRRSRQEEVVPARRGGAPVLAAALAGLLLVGALIALVVEQPTPRPGPPARPATASPVASAPLAAGTRHHTDTSTSEWIAAAALAGAGVAVSVVSARRRRGRVRTPSAPQASVPPAGGETDEWPTDPRAVVLTAYARAERRLAAGGLARRRDEGPREFCARLRAADTVDHDAAAALTPLYERARYSDHEISRARADAAARAGERLPRAC
jgi:hypothetical protein